MELLRCIDGKKMTNACPNHEVYLFQLPSGLYMVRVLCNVTGHFDAAYDTTSVYHDVALAVASSIAISL